MTARTPAKAAKPRRASAASAAKPGTKTAPRHRRAPEPPESAAKRKAAKPKPARKAKPAAEPKPVRRKTTARAAKPAPKLDLAALGATVVGVTAKTVLIEMPIKTAADLFPAPLEESGPSRVVEGVERELKAIAKRESALAKSALAGSAHALAREIDSPQTSPNAKAACGKELRETLARLAGLAPEEQKKGRLHDIRSGRADRLAPGSTASKG